MFDTATRKKINKVRKQIRGHMKAIADAENTTVSTVSRVLSGSRNNPDLLLRILAHANRIIGNEAEKAEMRSKEIDKLTSKVA